MTDTILTTKHLCRYYQRGRNEVRAVDGVTLSINKGEFVAVVGASGSGKSTFLNLLAGLDSPTSGHIEYLGRRLDHMSRRELSSYRAERVGIIFQAFNLLPQFTALRNVELAFFFSDTPPSERRARAKSLLQHVGLSERSDHHPSDLSGGERQRVAIARALVKKPDILLADEPTGNLDRTNSLVITNHLSELNRSGITIVLVTHDMELANATAGRIFRMHYGRIDEGFPTGAEKRS